MHLFKTCFNDYDNVDWEEFKKKYRDAKIEDSGYKLKIEYKGYTCYLMYEVRNYYSIAWFRGRERLEEDAITNDEEELMGWFLSDCIFYFHQDGVRAPPLPAVFGEPKGRPRPPPYQYSEFTQEHNPKHVISMLYELRDMCRSMHDGARTLR